ncbi:MULTISPECIES: DUF5590 domain-containing protein [Bacillus]|uniref:cell wall elongation regulator TseB-like domain-containing protein n=1 Tax=Bacillus TaxID=1386 RepID=UPI0030F723D7
MKKVMMIIAIIAVVVLAFSIYIYASAKKPYQKAEEEALKVAKDHGIILTVDKFYLYNSKKTYYVLIGENKKHEKMVAWIPKQRKDKILYDKYSNGISEQKAIDKLYQDEKPAKLLSVHLGMEEVGPVWEMAYLDKEGDLNYYYVLFKNGKWWKKMTNI